MFTLLLTVLAGVLTAFAPCVVPLLPVILGGSLTGKKQDRWRPYIITGSLVASLIVFTLLLKASTVLIGVDPRVWTYVSGGLVIGLGIFMLFPMAWVRVIGYLGLEHRAQSLLGKASSTSNDTLSAILIGVALGPVFSSCSPTYAWLIATVLPRNPFEGMIYLAAYSIGLAAALLAIALLGRKVITKAGWVIRPDGWFQRVVAILFIIVGLLIITGYDKKLQTYLVDKDFTGIKQLEDKIVPNEDTSRPSASFNVESYPAPELRGIEDWVNTEPLALKELRGKVVLIDFWTYSCINCQRTQPYLNAWYEKYHSKDFVIIGVHAPEFAFEKVKTNVERAVKEAGIQYPVALDNHFATWRAYQNQYWPAKYLIDKDGQVRYTHFGEGDYEETEAAIQELLRESGKNVSQNLTPEQRSASRSVQTPETYLGYGRMERFMNANELATDEIHAYTLSRDIRNNFWSLGGTWQVGSESSVSQADNAKLAINFSGKDVYLVMSGESGSRVTAMLQDAASPGGKDVSDAGEIVLNGPRLYHIVHSGDYLSGRTLYLQFPAQVAINAFTFGS